MNAVLNKSISKIIVGAGNTSQVGWLSLQRSDLDIRNFNSWQRLFIPNSLDAVLSEHVLEHLTISEALDTAQNIYTFLRKGGYWRIAVPDANNPNDKYKDWNAQGGFGQRLMRDWFYAADEPCHQVFYNLELLTQLLHQIGFSVNPLEYWGADGKFYKGNWSQQDGKIYRSYGNDYLSQAMFFTGVYNTSLIVDALKF